MPELASAPGVASEQLGRPPGLHQDRPPTQGSLMACLLPPQTSAGCSTRGVLCCRWLSVLRILPAQSCKASAPVSLTPAKARQHPEGLVTPTRELRGMGLRDPARPSSSRGSLDLRGADLIPLPIVQRKPFQTRARSQRPQTSEFTLHEGCGLLTRAS